MKFHECLKQIMNEKGITQAQLCNMTGIASSAMSHYYRGETDPSFTKAIQIARALDVPIDALAFNSPEHELSKEEKELVSLYRSLSDKGKHAVLAGLRDFANNHD